MNTKTLQTLALALAIGISLPALAQLPSQAGAMNTLRLPDGAIGVKVENIRRDVVDGGRRGSLEMSRLVVVAQTEVAPGISPWLEAGWHDPEIIPDSSTGGFTWGTGLHLRPALYPLRSDPQLGPRDWVALTVDLALKGGSAEVDWLSFEGVLGLEWHQKMMGVARGPVDASAVTAGAGVLINSLRAEQGNFDGSEDQAVGIRLHSGFSFGPNQFLHLQVDWYGSSDRIYSVASGFRF
jgi:hypothetical protein